MNTSSTYIDNYVGSYFYVVIQRKIKANLYHNVHSKVKSFWARNVHVMTRSPQGLRLPEGCIVQVIDGQVDCPICMRLFRVKLTFSAFHAVI